MESFFILFDELFRGTNVKDAHEATVAIIVKVARRQKVSSLFPLTLLKQVKNLSK